LLSDAATLPEIMPIANRRAVLARPAARKLGSFGKINDFEHGAMPIRPPVSFQAAP
jgi:hypothetical protein